MQESVRPDQPISASLSKWAALPLRVNFSWMLAGNVIYALSQWGMLVVLSKIGSTDMVGMFALSLAITAPVMALANLALEQAQVTDAQHEYLFGHYLGLRLVTTAMALPVIAGIALFSGYDHTLTLLIVVIGIGKAFQALSDVFFGLQQKHERMDRVARSLMIKGPLSLLALGAGVYLTGSLLFGSVLMAAVWGIMLLAYDINNARKLGNAITLSFDSSGSRDHRLLASISLMPRWGSRTLAKLAWLALPIAIASVLVSLNTNIPRYFIESYAGTSELGVFAALAYVMIAGRMLTQALGRSASPRMAKLYAGGDRQAFSRLLAKLVGTTVLGGVFAIIIAAMAGDTLLTLLYRAEYARTELFIVLLIASTIQFTSSFLGLAVNASRRFRMHVPLTALSTGSTLAACVLLVPDYGLLGAGFALVIGATLRLLCYLAVTAWLIGAMPEPRTRAGAPVASGN